MRVISRWTETGIEVFNAELEPVALFEVPPELHDWAVASTRDRLVHVTCAAVTCAGPDGKQLWRLPLTPPAGARSRHGACAWSRDDALVWVYLPDAEGDRCVALDAATGEPRAEHRLTTAGQGGQLLVTPDGRYTLLEVDEGENGASIFRIGPGGELTTYPWKDRGLVAVSPDGRQLMTVEHGQEDVAFHAFPGGDVRARVPITGFAELLGPGLNLDELFLEWAGGYLDDETAVVVISGEHSLEGEWWRHFLIGTRSGEVLRELGVVTIDAYDLKPLGDGTYVVTDTDGTLGRM